MAKTASAWRRPAAASLGGERAGLTHRLAPPGRCGSGGPAVRTSQADVEAVCPPHPACRDVAQRAKGARRQDIGNTMGLDMGNSFRFISRPFPGHDMEGSVSGWATAAV